MKKVYKVTKVYLVEAEDKSEAIEAVMRGQGEESHLAWQGVTENTGKATGWLGELKKQLLG